MAVDARHPDYNKHLTQWKKCRDAVMGEDAVKAAGTQYLPRLGGQDDIEYQGYNLRACFYEASGRTVKSLVGVVNRKPAVVTFPEKLKTSLLEVISPDGEPLKLIAQQTLEEVLGVGRVGLLVDSPENGEGDPYIALYYAENIVNWREEMLPDDEGKMRLQLTMVVLLENVEEVDPDDEFTVEVVERYRVLRLDTSAESPTDWFYYVELWKKEEEDENENQRNVRGKEKEEPQWIKEETYEPKMAGGRRPNFIPFTFINPASTGSECDNSPILGLVNMNLSHYRSSADLEHGRHLTALPTLYLIGFDPKGTEVKIGSSKAWVTENLNAKCGFNEFTGAGLSSLASAMKEKEQLMAVLGGRLLEEQKAQAESGVAIALRQAGEKSVLATVAGTVTEGLTKVLRWVGEWASASGSPETWGYTLNQKFNTAAVDAQTLTALMTGLQGGAYSFDAWYTMLEAAELYPEDWTKEKEQKAIAAGMPDPGAGRVVGEEVPPEGGDKPPAKKPTEVTSKRGAANPNPPPGV